MISELLPNQIIYNSHSNWHPSGHSSVTWSRSTNPSSIITWDEVVSMVNIYMLIISTIWLMLDLSVFRVPRPCLYMLGSSSLTRVFCMCKTGLHPLYANVESITPDHHVVLRNDEPSQRRTLGGNTILSWNFSEGSSYNATVVLSKIRCIKGLTSHANHKWHDMAINSCFWSPSPKHRHDLHRHRRHTMIPIIMISIIVSPSGLSRAHHALTTIATV